jgi:hypothetical protein
MDSNIRSPLGCRRLTDDGRRPTVLPPSVHSMYLSATRHLPLQHSLVPFELSEFSLSESVPIPSHDSDACGTRCGGVLHAVMTRVHCYYRRRAWLVRVAPKYTWRMEVLCGRNLRCGEELEQHYVTPVWNCMCSLRLRLYVYKHRTQLTVILLAFASSGVRSGSGARGSGDVEVAAQIRSGSVAPGGQQWPPRAPRAERHCCCCLAVGCR